MGDAFTSDWLDAHRVDVTQLDRTSVIGIGHVTQEVDGLIARLREPGRAAAMGLEPPRGILLYGAPGLGKTLVARYFAASVGADVPFYEVSADELSPERIRGAMRHLADAHPRSVLYLDEIDVFGMARDYAGHDTETRLRLTALLAALDGLRETAGPIVIASSNRPPGNLDAALVRAGRLGFRIRFDHPDENEREALMRLFTQRIPMEPAIDWRHLARLTRNRTPADLRQIVSDAAAIALTDGRDALRATDLLTAVRRDGRIEPEPPDAEANRWRIAIHESGHVAVSVALRGAAWVYSVRMDATEGRTSFGDEQQPENLRIDDELRDAMAAAYGGIAAEQLIFGEASLGGGIDVQNATRLALVRIRAGLAPNVTPVDLDQLERNVAESLKSELALDLATQLHGARERAMALVRENRAAILRFATGLVAAGELTGAALALALGHAGFGDWQNEAEKPATNGPSATNRTYGGPSDLPAGRESGS